jgi:PPK2 family polyphosphate:nucleotide phosphotransferase
MRTTQLHVSLLCAYGSIIRQQDLVFSEVLVLRIEATENLRVPPNKKIDLTDFDPRWIPKWAKEEDKKTVKQKALEILDVNRQKLTERQELFWASDSYALLVVLQGMDSAGKDSVIRHVMSGVNPQGCQVTSFKTPSAEELDHNFLWRHMKALPERGRIGIFNRSYYEDVLVVRVHPEWLTKQRLPPEEIGKDFWLHRYEDINAFEHHLVRNGVVVLKFFLHMSKEKQRRRLLKRLDDPNKHWKFSVSDLAERGKWDNYVRAYEDALSHTNTVWAPWFVIPADRRWVALASVSEILVDQIEKLNLHYPSADEAALKKARQQLEKEKG